VFRRGPPCCTHPDPRSLVWGGGRGDRECAFAAVCFEILAQIWLWGVSWGAGVWGRGWCSSLLVHWLLLFYSSSTAPLCRRLCPTQPPFSKQGRRSTARVRVVEWQTRGRSESERGVKAGASPPSTPVGGCGCAWPRRPHHSTRSTTRKLCELCLGRMKPSESLVEVRPCPNVQIGTRT
jgi:hypothetical protein